MRSHCDVIMAGFLTRISVAAVECSSKIEEELEENPCSQRVIRPPLEALPSETELQLSKSGDIL